MTDKINPWPWQRKAALPVRPSSPQQAVYHRENRRLQSAMQDRIEPLGWAEIAIIDDDFGRTANGIVARFGFERLVAVVSLGRVEAVAVRECSCFARDSRDWQPFIAVSQIVDPVRTDQDTVDDGCRGKRRFQLGWKGSLNECERNLLRLRGSEVPRVKAQRRELILGLPLGYLQGAGEHEKDPDERVPPAIRRVFDTFRELDAVRQVFCGLWVRACGAALRWENQAQVSWPALVTIQPWIAATPQSLVAGIETAVQVAANPQPGDIDVHIQTRTSTPSTRAVRARKQSPTVGGFAAGGSTTGHTIVEGTPVRSSRPGAPAPTPTRRQS